MAGSLEELPRHVNTRWKSHMSLQVGGVKPERSQRLNECSL
jgi:hypothetical protein